eukprot:CAMPEP_0183415358 /NCGR_PEP_ID=MMETSP0370-20130417/23037_1 /TAXON_ID=268820 /ORGANISM="Peridinium aciculiferum, Strain PAER-2" /LENGTH=67 /DNA_ID=CAMNT_0025598771 /DNA_START=235 /DNA_END=435 /DNA_ORIENTATION=+
MTKVRQSALLECIPGMRIETKKAAKIYIAPSLPQLSRRGRATHEVAMARTPTHSNERKLATACTSYE